MNETCPKCGYIRPPKSFRIFAALSHVSYDDPIIHQTDALRVCLEDWLNAYAGDVEGGEADELVKASRAALSNPTERAGKVTMAVSMKGHKTL